MKVEKSDYQFSIIEEEVMTRIVALGIGGMGRNAMENLAGSDMAGLEIYSLNTDMQALSECVGSLPVQIGAQRTAGKGAGGDSEVGRLSAEDDIAMLKGLVDGAELVFIVAGMGGGTGTGAAPVIAEMCRELGVLAIGVVTTPMECEGKRRMEKARQGLAGLRSQVDSLVVIENEKLSMIMDSDDISILEVFRRADNVLVDGIAAISRMINSHGYINLDLADLRNVLRRRSESECADALITIGTAEGENRAAVAAAMAMENPLLARGDIKGAENLLINVCGSESMGLNEAHGVVQAIVDQAGAGEREIFMGIVTDNSLGDKISVTLIATGPSFEDRSRSATLKTVGKDDLITEKAGRKTIAPAVRISDDNAAAVDSNIAAQPSRFFTDVDNFGASPLIKREEWLVPAYARRQCRYSDLDAPPAVERMNDNIIREELNALKRVRGKNKRIYQEPTLRMAC